MDVMLQGNCPIMSTSKASVLLSRHCSLSISAKATGQSINTNLKMAMNAEEVAYAYA